jgi:hypothetical protein
MKSCLADLDVAVGAWVLGLLDSRDLPNIATAALSKGLDGQRLRELAGLSPADIAEASGIFESAIHEVGWTIPDRRQAAARYARCVAQLIVAGDVAPGDGAKALWRASLAVQDHSFHDLDPFVYAGSEYDDRPADRALFDAAILEEARRWVSR